MFYLPTPSPVPECVLSILSQNVWCFKPNPCLRMSDVSTLSPASECLMSRPYLLSQNVWCPDPISSTRIIAECVLSRRDLLSQDVRCPRSHFLSRNVSQTASSVPECLMSQPISFPRMCDALKSYDQNVWCPQLGLPLCGISHVQVTLRISDGTLQFLPNICVILASRCFKWSVLCPVNRDTTHVPALVDEYMCDGWSWHFMPRTRVVLLWRFKSVDARCHMQARYAPKRLLTPLNTP